MRDLLKALGTALTLVFLLLWTLLLIPFYGSRRRRLVIWTLLALGLLFLLTGAGVSVPRLATAG